MQFTSLRSQYIQIDFHWSVILTKREVFTYHQSIQKLLRSMDDFYQQKVIPQYWKEKKWQISLYLCGDRKMKKINSTFRKKNQTTDVLSFPQFPSMRKSRKEKLLFDTLSLGDIVISFDKMKKQAALYKIKDSDEWIHLITHGFFHLLGFDHEVSKKEEKLMQGYEEKLISKIGHSSMKKSALKI
jgi:probable rRNA maturation factor